MTPITYTIRQMNEIVDFISEHYAGGGWIAHEKESEYIHTDIHVSKDEDGKYFVTFGMGAAPMNAPIALLERAELVMHASCDLDMSDEKAKAMLNELLNLSKYPFREDTWLGMGHTINASKNFRETLGYESLLFAPTSLTFSPKDTTGNVKNINFLEIVPIYKDERKWIMENDSFAYLAMLYDKFGDDLFKMDLQREHYIPSVQEMLDWEESFADELN